MTTTMNLSQQLEGLISAMQSENDKFGAYCAEQVERRAERVRTLAGERGGLVEGLATHSADVRKRLAHIDGELRALAAEPAAVVRGDALPTAEIAGLPEDMPRVARRAPPSGVPARMLDKVAEALTPGRA